MIFTRAGSSPSASSWDRIESSSRTRRPSDRVRSHPIVRAGSRHVARPQPTSTRTRSPPSRVATAMVLVTDGAPPAPIRPQVRKKTSRTAHPVVPGASIALRSLLGRLVHAAAATVVLRLELGPVALALVAIDLARLLRKDDVHCENSSRERCVYHECPPRARVPLRGRAPPPARPRGPQMRALARAQLSRRARRRGPCRRVDGVAFRLPAPLRRVEAALRRARSSLSERSAGPREPHERSARGLDLVAHQANPCTARPGHRLRDVRVALRVRGHVSKTLACRCEDVTLRDLEEAIARGYTDIESLKRYTGFGTGWCQGKGCVALCARLLVERGGTAKFLITPRPPLHPIALGVLAGLAAIAEADERAGRPPR